MRFLSWMKVLGAGLLLLMATAYVGFNSDWFQKKYVYPFLYKDLILQYSAKNNIDPFLVVAVTRTESKFISQARSPKGAVGLMQMMPETATWVASQMEYHDFKIEDLENPEVSIKLGTWYLASLKKEFNNNEILMLAAYNAGRGNVKQWMRQYGWTMAFKEIEQIPFQETREYVGKVLRSKARYRELYNNER